jgi:hypothetical protein
LSEGFYCFLGLLFGRFNALLIVGIQPCNRDRLPLLADFSTVSSVEDLCPQ